MNRATKIALINLNNSNLHLRTAFFHSTPVLDRRRRTHWESAGSFYRSSSRRPNFNSRRQRKFFAKHEMLRNASAFAENIFQGLNDDDEFDPSSSQGSSWFRGHSGPGGTRGNSKGAQARARKKRFQFYEDGEDVETIFRSAFGGNGFYFWSFINDESPRNSSGFYNNHGASWNFRHQFEDEDEDGYSSESNRLETDLTKDRITLGLTRSGPLNLEFKAKNLVNQYIIFLPLDFRLFISVSYSRMGGKLGLVFVFLLAVGLVCEARELTSSFRNKVSAISVLQSKAAKRFGVLGNEGKNDNLCTLCEEYASEALFYLEQNKTQKEIISALHESCDKLQSLKKQCITLVDYYAPLFFLEISTVKPEDFCGKVGLCKEIVAYAHEFSENSCDVCHLAVSEAVSLLKDPDNQLEILQLLLKQCKTVEKYLPKCKSLVFEYAPLILANAEQFLEKEDICSKLHACDSYEQVPLISDN